jgi:hypothetical protein
MTLVSLRLVAVTPCKSPPVRDLVAHRHGGVRRQSPRPASLARNFSFQKTRRELSTRFPERTSPCHRRRSPPQTFAKPSPQRRGSPRTSRQEYQAQRHAVPRQSKERPGDRRHRTLQPERKSLMSQVWAAQRLNFSRKGGCTPSRNLHPRS